MSDFTTEVIRYLRQKTDEGFDSVTYLGAEQRFINALRNSGINNLEEQFIIGTETYTTTYLDDNGNNIEEKEFRLGSSTNNYYKLITIDYSKGVKNKDFFFDDNDNSFKLPYDSSQIRWGTLSDDLEEVLICEDGDAFSISNSILSIIPSSFITTKVQDLYFISSDNTEVHVLNKTTNIKYIKDKTYTQEIVTNYLRS